LNDQIDAENLDNAEYQAWMNEFQQWQGALADYAPAALLDKMMKDEHFLAFQRDFEAFQAEFKQFQQELQKAVSKREYQMAGGDEGSTRKSGDEPPATVSAEEYADRMWSEQRANNDDNKSDDAPQMG
jgi:hypothetical protein